MKTLQMKIFNYKLINIISIVSVLGFYACASSHTITASWKSQNIPDKKYEKLFVAVLTENLASRTVMENAMSNEIKERGGNSIRSLDVIPPNMNSSDTIVIMQKVKENNCDGLITIALMDTKTDEYYVPGITESYSSGGAYSPGNSYYRNYADNQYDNRSNYNRGQGNPNGYSDPKLNRKARENKSLIVVNATLEHQIGCY